MRSLKVTLHVLILVGMIFLAVGLAAAQETRPRLAQVIYITKSDHCGCDDERYWNANAAVDQVFAGPRRQLVKRIDYSLDHQAAVPYIGEYRLNMLPALLFLDAQAHLLWSALGVITEKEVQEQFNQFGG
jgi:hypothetical protein